MTTNNKKDEAREPVLAQGQKEWFTPKVMFEDYGISTSTQAKMRMDRKIPFSKIGKYIRYSRTEINKWLMAHSVEVA